MANAPGTLSQQSLSSPAGAFGVSIHTVQTVLIEDPTCTEPPNLCEDEQTKKTQQQSLGERGQMPFLALRDYECHMRDV
jgi:hypothetical protein